MPVPSVNDRLTNIFRTDPQHLLIPFAAPLSEAGTHAMRTLALPQLERLLGRLQPIDTLGPDEWSMTPPHELAFGRALGWQADDGLWPFAARLALADGLHPKPGEGWGLLTPAHWHLGTEQISLLHPAELQLDEADSRALLDALRPLLESEGWALHWATPTRWYATHTSLAALPCASLDRVIGRNIDPWLPPTAPAKLVRRLQSEVQMLLYTHAINDEREARGALAVNSFWISDCGAAQAPATMEPTIDDRLRDSALREDWATWADDWRALDAGPMSELLSRSQQGEPVQLTLCGERHARRYAAAAQGLWQRMRSAWRGVDVHAELQSL